MVYAPLNQLNKLRNVQRTHLRHIVWGSVLENSVTANSMRNDQTARMRRRIYDLVVWGSFNVDSGYVQFLYAAGVNICSCDCFWVRCSANPKAVTWTDIYPKSSHMNRYLPQKQSHEQIFTPKAVTWTDIYPSCIHKTNSCRQGSLWCTQQEYSYWDNRQQVRISAYASTHRLICALVGGYLNMNILVMYIRDCLVCNYWFYVLR